MSVELKPCPFCGGTPVLQRVGNDFTRLRKVIIKCPSCRTQRTDAALRRSMEWLIGVATEHWNRRAQQAKADKWVPKPYLCKECTLDGISHG